MPTESCWPLRRARPRLYHKAQPGLGDGPDLNPHGAWLCLPLRRRGLVQSAGSVVAIVNHDGGGLLYRSG